MLTSRQWVCGLSLYIYVNFYVGLKIALWSVEGKRNRSYLWGLKLLCPEWDPEGWLARREKLAEQAADTWGDLPFREQKKIIKVCTSLRFLIAWKITDILIPPQVCNVHRNFEQFKFVSEPFEFIGMWKILWCRIFDSRLYGHQLIHIPSILKIICLFKRRTHFMLSFIAF